MMRTDIFQFIEGFADRVMTGESVMPALCNADANRSGRCCSFEADFASSCLVRLQCISKQIKPNQTFELFHSAARFSVPVRLPVYRAICGTCPTGFPVPADGQAALSGNKAEGEQNQGATRRNKAIQGETSSEIFSAIKADQSFMIKTRPGSIHSVAYPAFVARRRVPRVGWASRLPNPASRRILSNLRRLFPRTNDLGKMPKSAGETPTLPVEHAL
jgi:hypothetical protein